MATPSTGRMNRRLFADKVVKAISTGFAVVALLLLAWILWTLVYNGLSAISITTFTNDAFGRPQGLMNAIVGSLLQVGIATVIATPVGVLAGTYLAEQGKGSWIAETIRFINDVLLSAPSILIGLFVYTLIVVPMGRFSGWAGTVALAIIILPVVLRATEDMLRLVPTPLREAAFALGASHWTVVSAVQWKAARAGILTGLLLAVARAAGETAPLLFTAFGNPQFTVNLSSPMATLPVQIFNLTLSADPASIALAWAGALIITLGVLVLNVVSRLIIALGQRK
ncbi:phosphate ABC transporter permease PstA [Phreatobacter sp. AB_2022a]|uniref:phosphate ABC transporter permease PstA n=1 Tax=Phreatobacter sp. AB_2022a TaxID=3003134 RepID=UPI000579ADEB|nr:phosphate ABC transporter permease PstA [Phreatobacter sp. AB_2022a]MCZ0736543.1 phosphate ABC transporter permease PstA [Phreatobacter sp. AB_2022a]CEJ12980.1 Phosphate transport system permease protein PstA [bacterium YEK0313]